MGETLMLLSGYLNILVCETLGRIAKDPRFDRLPCTHKGTYADDCLVQRVTQVACQRLIYARFVFCVHQMFYVLS